MRFDLTDSSILVTGGTGSFGRHFVRTVLEHHSVRRIIVFSRDELKQYEMANESWCRGRSEVRFFLGDVRDIDRLNLAMRDVDAIVHAAALKHVPTAEYNPSECILTNVMGAQNVIRAALADKVKRIVALSTDKACNPVNLYGATKLASDKLFVAANNLVGDRSTRFAVVRYGNVLGSRGSVVPYFRSLIADGAESLPLTDPRMTRFWITMQQGVDFVINALQTMAGGEIFVPKLPSMRIVDLARAMAPDLPHRVVGIRPGEKLHEIMISVDDARNTVDYPNYYVINPSYAFWDREPVVDVEGQPVPEGFQYTSDSNQQWLDESTIHNYLVSC